MSEANGDTVHGVVAQPGNLEKAMRELWGSGTGFWIPVFEGDADFDAPTPTHGDAAQFVADHIHEFSLAPDEAVRFYQKVLALKATEGKRALVAAFHQWSHDHWEAIAANVRNEMASLVESTRYDDQVQFSQLIAGFGKLASCPVFLEQAMRSISATQFADYIVLSNLALLQGGKGPATLLLARALRHHVPLRCRKEFMRLFTKWAGQSSWTHLHGLLWQEGDFAPSEHLQDVANATVEAARLLREAEFSPVTSPTYHLRNLSPESRVSWRHQLGEVLHNDFDLKKAVAEAILWYAPPYDDREALLSTIEVCGDDLAAALAPLKDHPDELVRRRALATALMVHSEPDVADRLQTYHRVHASRRGTSSEALTVGRTWIRDHRIEEFIRFALVAVAEDVSHDINDTLASSEEAHVAILLERLRTSFREVNAKLSEFAEQSEATSKLEIQLNHRIVGKQEEGGAGLGTETFSADVCLILRLKEAGSLFAERASLIQAKRLYRAKGLKRKDYYPLKLDQLKDLANQTSSSFLMLLGPTCHGISIPVLPARLVRDLVARGEPASYMTPGNASSLGKGIGDWLLDDVIGLWTGDDQAELLEKAWGGKDRRPYVLAELTLERVPVSFDQ